MVIRQRESSVTQHQVLILHTAIEMYITILHGIDVGEIETDSIKYHNYLNTLYSYNECKKETEY